MRQEWMVWKCWGFHYSFYVKGFYLNGWVLHEASPLPLQIPHLSKRKLSQAGLPKQECQPSHCLFWHLSTLTGQSWHWENLSKNLNRLTLELTHRNWKYSGFRSYLQFHVLICKINRIGNLVTAPGKLDWSNPLCKYQYNYPIPKNLYHYGTYKGYSTWAWQLACSLISPVN